MPRRTVCFCSNTYFNSPAKNCVPYCISTLQSCAFSGVTMRTLRDYLHFFSNYNFQSTLQARDRNRNTNQITSLFQLIKRKLSCSKILLHLCMKRHFLFKFKYESFLSKYAGSIFFFWKNLFPLRSMKSMVKVKISLM